MSTLPATRLLAHDGLPAAFVIHLLDPARCGQAALLAIQGSKTPLSQPVVLFTDVPPAAMVQAMPVGLPWMQADGPVEAALAQLENGLLGPVREPGLFGIDLADIWTAVSVGGQLQCAQACGQSPQQCLAAMPLPPAGAVACCLRLQIPPQVEMEQAAKAMAAYMAAAGMAADEGFWPLALQVTGVPQVQASALWVQPGVSGLHVSAQVTLQ